MKEEYGEAEEVLKQSLRLDASRSEAYKSLGLLYLSTDRIDKSDQAFRQSVSLQPTKTESVVEVAKALMDEGDYVAAINTLNDCLKSKDKDCEILNLLAIALLKSEKLGKAEKAAKESIKLNESYVDGWITLGQIFGQRGKNKDSLTALRKAIELDPMNSSAFIKMGNTYARMKNFDDAISSFQQAIRIDPDNEIARNNLEVMHRHLGLR